MKGRQPAEPGFALLGGGEALLQVGALWMQMHVLQLPLLRALGADRVLGFQMFVPW